MTQTNRVSVIVPVYNCETYLKRCLDSVVAQSHRELEVILVDDGSTDASGTICDAYVAQDSRFQVIHQENQGVAAARNAGLDRATGAYIGWVDSDDYIEPQMFELMVACAETHQADIVICGRQERYPDQSFAMGWQQLELLDRDQALIALVEDDLVRSYFCDKLWRRELFDGIRIPPLKVYEDMAVMHQLFLQARRVACLPQILYHYEHRLDSLSVVPSLSSRLDFYQVVQERYRTLKEDFPQVVSPLEVVLAARAVDVWAVYLDHSKEERDRYRPQIVEMAAFCKRHYKAALVHGKLGLAGRLVLRLTPYPRWWSFALAGLISKLYQKRHGRVL